MNKSVEFIAMGCRLNALEAEKIKAMLAAALPGRAIAVNTCAVTSEAERQSKQAIRKLARENPGVPLFVTGCAATRDPKGFAAIPGVTRVIANKDKMNPEAYGIKFTARQPPLTAHHSLSKGFVQIQNGCNHSCAYCIVSRLRGRNVSFPYRQILAQTRALTDNGYGEIVLTGVDIAGWRRPMPADAGESLELRVESLDNQSSQLSTLNSKLSDLCSQLLSDIPELKRLRLSSLDPGADLRPIIDVMRKDPRMLPHMHLSMQSGSDEVLARMGRRHNARMVKELVEYCNNPRPCGGGRGKAAGGGLNESKYQNQPHHQTYRPCIKRFAKNMRINPTPEEDKFWQAVRNKRLGGFTFRRQRQFDNKYIADFVCYEKKLIVEIDGSQHYENKKDKIRTEYLQKFGFNIVRFWNWDINKQLTGCLEVIHDILTNNTFEKRLKWFNENLDNMKVDDKGNVVLLNPPPGADAPTPAARAGANRLITFSWDLICGFPGETKELFDETCALIRELKPIRLHAFPFSPRPGTPAATMPGQVDRTESKRRVHAVMELARENMLEFMRGRIGKRARVLVEENNLARDEHDIPVRIAGGEAIPPRSIVEVELTRVEDDVFIANL